MMKGYKAFNKDETNRYGKKYEENTVYKAEGPLQFGNHGNGFHFCKRLEDTLRYFPAMEEEIQIAEVTSLGEQVEYDDDYYGYYDLFAARTIRIDKFLTREEIVDMYLVMDNDDRIKEASVLYDLGDKTKAEVLCEQLKKAYDESKIECSGTKITVKGMDDFTEDVKDSVKMVGRTKDEFTKEAVSAGYTCK